MVAEGFALVNVRDMYFNKRDRHRSERIAQRHARVGQSARIDDDRVDAFLAGGMDAVDQPIINSGWPNSTGWPFSTRILVTTPDTSESISLSSFIASMMHRVSPSLMVEPTST